MPFILATHAHDVQQAKDDAQKAQAAAYRHDVAWSAYAESPAVAAWIRAYAKNARFPIFLSGPDKLPAASAFIGPHAGYNAGLLLGFLFNQPVILLGDADLAANASDNLHALKDADAVQGACTGAVDEPAFFQDAVRKALQSLSAGVIRADYAAAQLQAALQCDLPADYVLPCHQSLLVNPPALQNACLPPDGPAPLDVYASQAFRFGVRVLEPTFVWTAHPAGKSPDVGGLEKSWTAREQTNAYLRILDYVLNTTNMRTSSDFLIDEALRQAYYAPQPVITEAQYQQIVSLKRPSLSLAYARLTRAPSQPDKAATKRAIKTYLAAQLTWKETLRAAGEAGLEEKLRIK